MPATRTHYDRRRWIWIVTAFGTVLLNTGVLNAGPPRIAFLAVESSLGDMGPHNQAAWQTAAMLGQATFLLRGIKGVPYIFRKHFFPLPSSALGQGKGMLFS